MIAKGMRDIARIKLGDSALKTVTMCNDLADKYGEIGKQLMKELDKIEKKYPVIYIFKKEWIKVWRRFMTNIRRFEYYHSIAGRLLTESKEYLKGGKE